MVTKALTASAAFGSSEASDAIQKILQDLELNQAPPKLSEKQVQFLGKKIEQQGQPNE